jgi:uncharacterized protein
MHFNLYEDRAGEWRWRLIASNGKTVADSGEGYSSKAKAQAGIASVKEGAAAAPVHEEPREP